MKLSLSIKDRLTIHGILPAKGKLEDMILARRVALKSQIGNGEAEVIHLKSLNGQWKWDESKATEKEIEFMEDETTFMKARVAKMDKEEAVEAALLGVCVKINTGKPLEEIEAKEEPRGRIILLNGQGK
jgi:hypothetical protein